MSHIVINTLASALLVRLKFGLKLVQSLVEVVIRSARVFRLTRILIVALTLCQVRASHQGAPVLRAHWHLRLTASSDHRRTHLVLVFCQSSVLVTNHVPFLSNA